MGLEPAVRSKQMTIARELTALVPQEMGLAAMHSKNEMDNNMTNFNTEMEQFFTRNCYFERQREEVKASPPYQLAVEMNDPTQAQEIATRVLELHFLKDGNRT